MDTLLTSDWDRADAMDYGAAVTLCAPLSALLYYSCMVSQERAIY